MITSLPAMMALLASFLTALDAFTFFDNDISKETPSSDVESSEGASIFWSSIDVKVGDRIILEVPGGALPAGRLLGILGPSGSGKSTFLNTISHRARSTSRLVPSSQKLR